MCLKVWCVGTSAEVSMSNEMLCLHVMQQPQVPNPPLWWRVLTTLLAPANGGSCGGREQCTKLPFSISGYYAKACALCVVVIPVMFLKYGECWVMLVWEEETCSVTERLGTGGRTGNDWGKWWDVDAPSEILFLTQTLIVNVTCNNNSPIDIKPTSALIQDPLTAAYF